MNFLDYLVNAMTGAAPSQQELMMRDMATKGLLQQSSMGLTPEELKLLRQQSGAATTPTEIQAIQNERLRRQSGAAISPSELQMLNNSGQSQYMQNLVNPGMTMRQNYVDPRLIEQMYYRGLLSK